MVDSVTPDFPNGTYAYFTTLDLTPSADGSFKNFKNQLFPYVIGEFFQSKPNTFNYDLNSTQDNYDLNNSNWRRNTSAYALDKSNSGYDYFQEPYDFTTQDSIIKSVEKGYIDSVGIVREDKTTKLMIELFLKKIKDSFLLLEFLKLVA